MSDQGIPPRRPSGGFDPPGQRVSSGETPAIARVSRALLSETRASLETATQSVRRGLAEIEDLMVETLAALEHERTESEGLVRALEGEADELRQALASRTEDLQEARAEVAAALEAADNAAAEASALVEALRGELELAEAERAAAEASRGVLEEELEAAGQQLEATLSQLETATAQLDSASQQFEGATKDAAALRRDLAKAQQHIESHEAELEALREEVLEATQTHLDLAQQISARDATIADLEAELERERQRGHIRAERPARGASEKTGEPERHPSWPTGTPRAVPQRTPPSRRRASGNIPVKPLTHEVLHTMSPEDAERLAAILHERPLLDPHAVLAEIDVNSRAAYLLTRLDGSVSIRDLIDTAGMPRDEAAAILLDLHLREVF